MDEKQIAFYVMNPKGFYVLNNFIKKFGSSPINYVVSSEDKKLKKDFYLEIIKLCKENNIKVFNRTDNFDQIEREFKGYKFAIGWRWLIKNKNNLIVFHDSLLPKYRGFAPLVNSLINGERFIGVTAILGSDEYDKGEILAQRSLEVKYPIKIKEAIEKIQPLYYELVEEIYLKILNDEYLQTITQDEREASYSIWLDDKDYFIDWSWDAEKIKRFVDAVGDPYDNAKAYLNGKLIKIYEAEVYQYDVLVINRERHIGKVIFMRNEMPVIICGKDLLLIKEIRDKDGNLLKINFRSRFE